MDTGSQASMDAEANKAANRRSSQRSEVSLKLQCLGELQ